MVNIKEVSQVNFNDLPLDEMAKVLKRPSLKEGERIEINEALLKQYNLSGLDIKFDNMILSPRGVYYDGNGFKGLNICKSCLKSINDCKVSKMFIAARNIIGTLPSKFDDSTRTEHALINPAQHSVYLATIHGSGGAKSINSHSYTMRATKQPLAAELPRSINDLETIKVTLSSSLTPLQKADIVQDSVGSTIGAVNASDIFKIRNRQDIDDLKKKLETPTQPTPSTNNSQQNYTTHSKAQLVSVIMTSERDTKWRSPLPGSRPSKMALPEYSTIGSISRHLCLMFEQHLMFVRFARSIMHFVGDAHEIPEDDLPSTIRGKDRQDIGFLNGGAGFGKSAVISSLQFLATNWKVPGAVRTSSFCGIAASAIKGSTLSSMFGWKFMGIGYTSSNPKPSTDICKKDFASVALLVIDEVSTLTQAHFGLLEDSLSQLRKSDLPAGGFNLLLLGDFLQLGPVSGCRKFVKPNEIDLNVKKRNAKQELTRGEIDQSQCDKKIRNADSTYLYRLRGYELYSKINYVVTLRENWRHKGNSFWVEILNRWRIGNFIESDIAYANRICKRKEVGEHSAKCYSPIIVTTNELRHDFNSLCTERFAASSSQSIYRCHAKLKTKTSTANIRFLRSLSESRTSKMSMQLDLVLGMPMTTTSNHPNRKLQIANGSLGWLVGIQVFKSSY